MSVQNWDQRYSHPNHVYGYRPNDFLVAQARFLRPRARILCIGDGEGRNGVFLAGLGHQVVSLDFSRVGLDKAEALARDKGVGLETWCVDLAEWVHHPPPAYRWDAVVSVFPHLEPGLRRQVAATVTSQCAPGAMLVLEEFTPAQPALGSGGPTDPQVLLTRPQAQEDWVGWHLDVRLVERRIFEGMAHQGVCSVVQALGKL